MVFLCGLFICVCLATPCCSLVIILPLFKTNVSVFSLASNLALHLSESRLHTLNSVTTIPESSRVAVDHSVQMSRMTMQIPTMPEYNLSGTKIRVQCCSRCLNHLPTVKFNMPKPACLLHKAPHYF